MKDISTNQSEAVKEYLDFLDRSRRTTKETRLQIHEKLMSKDVADTYGETEEEMKQLDVFLKQDTSVYPTPEEIENGAEDTYTLEHTKFKKKEVIQTASNDGCTAVECEV